MPIELACHLWANLCPHGANTCENTSAGIRAHELRTNRSANVRTEERAEKCDRKELINRGAVH